jgi:hypothetical protein
MIEFMTAKNLNSVPRSARLHQLTKTWGSRAAVTLYLDRCQIDTPADVIARVWAQVYRRRSSIGKVVDFGAGDGRFSGAEGVFQYVGYEIDGERCRSASLPRNARLIQKCAFSESITDADICLGNPPYVRNQDLPLGWRQRAAASLVDRTGIELSGLANAWQYFFLLCLASTKKSGLVAIVIPYEWVSRPSAKALRSFIQANGWNVDVYRLRDETFDRVLTTSSITVVDKRGTAGRWRFYDETVDGRFRLSLSESGAKEGVVNYSKRSSMATDKTFAKRGLSPGTQEVLTLTEGERVRAGLRIGSDVVPCVTSLRQVDADCNELTEDVFNRTFRRAGLKCWLIRTDREPSPRLLEYLANIPAAKYYTATCLARGCWWKFAMPTAPSILIASGFRGAFPKVVTNSVGARAVGAVCGIYGVSKPLRRKLPAALRSLDLSDRIVPHSNGLRKLEVNQLNTLVSQLIKSQVGLL